MLLWTQLITLWPILFNEKSFVLCALDVILKKIQKRSLETFGNETHGNEDNELLEIEHELQKAARPLGDEGKKYVKLILREIQSGKSKKKSNNGDNKRKSKNIAIMALESDENSTRLSMIDYLIKKINKISLESVSNFTNAQMGNVLNSIEKKLKKAAAHLGDKGEKYVNIIMRGIQNTYKNTTANYALSNARRRYLDQNRKETSQNSKLDYFLENISKISSDVSNNYGNKEKLDAVEKKLKLAAQRLGKNGKKYVNIIMKAVRSDKGVSKTPLKNIISTEVEKVVENAITLNNVIKTDKYNNILRKQAVRDVANEIEKLFKTFYKSNKYLIEELQLKTFEAMKEHNMLKNSEDVKFMSDFIVDAINAAILFQKSNRRNSRTRKVSSDTKIEFQRHTTKRLRSQIKRCKNRVNITCSNIKSMNSYTCAYDDQIIPINKLCDGKDDCFDSSDETFCVKQTIEKLRFAHEVLAAIDRDLEYKCLTSDIDEGILSKQNLVLRDVLKTQSDLIEKYKSEHLSESNEEKATSLSNDITGIIENLSKALGHALCSQELDTRDLRRFNEVLEKDDPWPKDIWPPKTCNCSQELCPNCTHLCKIICWHQSSLSSWNCDSVNERSLVPLNVVCDGKIDCFDESDEKGCFADTTLGKFESHKIFSEMTDSLKIKANKEYKVARKTIWILINVLFDLQKLSLNSNPDPALLKEYRQRCFSLISTIYSQLLKHTSYPNEAEELYKFLLSINQQTGDIIKRIGTGNKKIISDECFCREDKCAASVCSRKCQKACAVKPRLTKYACSGNNKSVDIDHICDGFNNCPMKDDEQDCRQDICRSYHLAILRLKVEKVGSKQKGTAMGEVLSTWKAKVISTLKVAERTGKPTPKIIKDIIKDILRDLVVTYGSVEEYRRKDNHYALQEFSDIAKSIQDAVRSCGR